MKTVYILAHHFHENTMGAYRLRRIARYLPRFGYRPVVFAHDKGKGNIPDACPEGSVVNVPSPDLAALYQRWTQGRKTRAQKAEPSGTVIVRDIGFTSFLNRWLMIPDKQMLWRRPGIRAALRYVSNRPPDLLFASCEPRTNLMVGAAIARRLGVPYVAEYRDLWTGSPYFHNEQPTVLHRALHYRMQRKAWREATRITCVSAEMARLIGAASGDSVDVHYNFYDPKEYENIPVPTRSPDAPFILNYIGSLYRTRTPEATLRGVGLFLKKREIAPSEFRFRWVGSITSVPHVEETIAETGLAPYIDYLGVIPHREALKDLMQCDASLIIQATNDTIHIPGKLFEAMGARRPVLSVSPPCEHTEIVERTRCGVTAPHEPVAIEHALGILWDQRKSGQPWTYNEDAVAAFSASRVVGGLAGLFDETLMNV